MILSASIGGQFATERKKEERKKRIVGGKPFYIRLESVFSPLRLVDPQSFYQDLYLDS